MVRRVGAIAVVLSALWCAALADAGTRAAGAGCGVLIIGPLSLPVAVWCTSYTAHISASPGTTVIYGPFIFTAGVFAGCISGTAVCALVYSG